MILFEIADFNLGLRLTNFLFYFEHCKSTLKVILFASDQQNVMVCQKVTFVVNVLPSYALLEVIGNVECHFVLVHLKPSQDVLQYCPTQKFPPNIIFALFVRFVYYLPHVRVLCICMAMFKVLHYEK
jgi:hypothetical protein